MIERILTNEWRFLTFRRTDSHLRENPGAYLIFGFVCTWLVGIGRYWDNPRAELWQSLGLGSLLYVTALALIIWVLIIPLRPGNWSYRNVLLFVTLTAPPAALYAIPVERFMTQNAAATANIWFLAVVSGWRVALLGRFLYRTAGLDAFAAAAGAAAPLVLIVVSLGILYLEHAAFRLMSGIPAEEQTANDAAYGVVVLLSILALSMVPILAIAYLILCYRAWQRNRSAARK